MSLNISDLINCLADARPEERKTVRDLLSDVCCEPQASKQATPARGLDSPPESDDDIDTWIAGADFKKDQWVDFTVGGKAFPRRIKPYIASGTATRDIAKGETVRWNHGTGGLG